MLDASSNRISAPQLFLIFSRIGLTSFGGGLSGWLLREFVQSRKWLTEEEFFSGLAISQASACLEAIFRCALATGSRNRSETGRCRDDPGVCLCPDPHAGWGLAGAAARNCLDRRAYDDAGEPICGCRGGHGDFHFPSCSLAGLIDLLPQLGREQVNSTLLMRMTLSKLLRCDGCGAPRSLSGQLRPSRPGPAHVCRPSASGRKRCGAETFCVVEGDPCGCYLGNSASQDVC